MKIIITKQEAIDNFIKQNPQYKDCEVEIEGIVNNLIPNHPPKILQPTKKEYEPYVPPDIMEGTEGHKVRIMSLGEAINVKDNIPKEFEKPLKSFDKK